MDLPEMEIQIIREKMAKIRKWKKTLEQRIYLDIKNKVVHSYYEKKIRSSFSLRLYMLQMLSLSNNQEIFSLLNL